MKLHHLSLNSVPDTRKAIEVQKALEINLGHYFHPDNFIVDGDTISFTTDITLHGPCLEACIMETHATSYILNQDF